MGQEIERKFLVKDETWRSQATGSVYRQGYISTESGVTVRVRIAGTTGYLTIKGPTTGISRSEFEYPIPLADAESMLAHLCDRPIIEKTRYVVQVDGVKWEIDEFDGDNRGLIMAEVELEDADQTVYLPDWIGEEVSGDMRYYNAYLAKHPYTTWSERRS